MNTKTVSIVIVIVLVLLGGWYLLSGNSSNTSQTPAADTTQTTTTTAAPPTGVTVTYSDSGFSPANVAVKAGQSVMWVDQRTSPMWIASAQHPSHTGYDGTSRNEHCAAGYAGATPFDECSGGTTYTFTFTKAGTWGYHDHFDSSKWGTVTVTQ
ncbi:MAG: hypothetical protein HY221_01040 [Candidatus Sungbacteria bacterium]|uniref:EfeO-type cupredoxin-like domain-containing protein n=1 Tax=Candidatus Sungiibacteriota bacterium TaxID=2750080 RepID=A0A932R1D2_9BACT|nr:hypothetical protein [Candidatus Sungbacteria bacterium]